MKPAIEIKNLSVNIANKLILNDISVQVNKGEITGLLGPSGSGKTSLIRSLLGLQAIKNGSISVLGLMPGTPGLRPLVGYVAQAPAVYTDLSVRENLAYFAALLGLKKSAVESAINSVDMDGLKNRIVANLSGGEKARISLAAALLGRPEILLLDEPTVGLDPVLRKKLWQKFFELAQSGTAILITSHVMDEAEKCDKILFIREGKLLVSGTRTNILNQTKAVSMETAFLKLAKGPSHEA